MTGKISVLNTELVTGHCPSCELDTILVGIQQSFYRCTNCGDDIEQKVNGCLLYTSPSPRDRTRSRMPSSA